MSGTEQVTAGLQETNSRHGAAYSREQLKQRIRMALEAGAISKDYARTLEELLTMLR